MIRAALILALLASPAAAQTQGALKAGDALRQCLHGSGPLSTPAQFRNGLNAAKAFGWVETRINPEMHRLDQGDISIEIQFSDLEGTAYCIVFGPALQPGDAMMAADRAIAQGLMPPLTRRVEPPPQGLSRYYMLQEGPTKRALMAYTNADAGEVVGFVLSVAPQGRPVEQPQQPPQDAAIANFTLAAELCMRPGIGGPQRAQMFRKAGFGERVDRSTGNSDTTHYFTAPGNTATAQLYYGEMPSDCFATSTSLGVTQASQILDGLAPRLYPSYLRTVTQGPGGAICVTYRQPGTPIPHTLGVSAQDVAQGCVDNGTARIFEYTAV